MTALPGHSAAVDGDEPTTMPARNSQATAFDADDATRKAPGVSGAYIYGYDSAGNPTLTDAGSHGSSDGKVPARATGR